MSKVLFEKVRLGQEVVGVIGLGYVGLPLALSFAEANVKVIGFDKSVEKVNKINAGKNYIADVRDKTLEDAIYEQLLGATTDFSRLAECDVILICVPTPLDKFLKPDMSYIEDACLQIGNYLTPDTFICLESTTYPTTTEDVMLPIIELNSGLKEGKDFWLAYSPERVDPGNKNFNTKNTPKVLGATNEVGLNLGIEIYQKAIKTIHPVSSPKVAEMVKILENTYRLVNISLINELALLSGKMGIDIWEVIEAAKTKPFGFQAFYPGPGIGGHCIPLDPFYLEYIAKQFEFDLSLIHTAGHINMRMPHYMYIKIATALNSQSKAVRGSKVLMIGVAYKPNIDDARESPSIKIMEKLVHKGALVQYHDPYVADIILNREEVFKSIALDAAAVKDADVVVITTGHDGIDYDLIKANAKLIVDLRNKFDIGEGVFKL